MKVLSQTQIGSLIAITLIVSAAITASSDLFLRLLIGLALGITLTKSAIGFAGSVNRAYRRGSTELIKTLMLMFVSASIMSAALLYSQGNEHFQLWVNPINAGLILGGLMFGFGMTLSSCCASGVMVEMVADVPRALTTLVAFGLGVYIGFPLQASASWITDSWLSSASYTDKGVFLPDWFSWGPLNGYLMAVLVTVVFAYIVVKLAERYQQTRKEQGRYLGVAAEEARQNLVLMQQGASKLSALWSMNFGAVVIAAIFTILMITTGAGWGASTPFGIWFGKLLIMLGVSASDVAQFSHKSVELFQTPVLQHGVSLQNIGILLGTVIAVLWLGKWRNPWVNSYTIKHYALFALGGISMGLGTRFANGCNVGALFTPIANFSLSGWVFFVALIIGCVVGNRFAQKVRMIG
ncbi:YeeE/YedE family protein [Paraferrimonas haliotis]|uniref:Membrane protein n=1 Tax=Paraferrimonas haliotis TaxID=2013866 RepID=A0AA37WXH5_9GAMM|nr:YeeE/YedE family protein [Paraferrimonas haliotis]GLS84588.1 membrane protein [Paraferrimonas haliotis]